MQISCPALDALLVPPEPLVISGRNDEGVTLAPRAGHPGVLITFEGGDGSGKSTHIAFLGAILSDLGLAVVRVREPGGTALGEALREMVLDVGNEGMSPRAELLIYEAARAQLVDDIIAPALDAGAVVLCDRFTDSTMAYQGYGRGLDCAFIREVNAFAADDIVPDVTVVLHCTDREEKQSRVDRREDDKDRLELAGTSFHTRVIEGFRTLAAEDAKRVVMIDTIGRHSDTARAVFAAIAPVVPALANGELDLDAVLSAYDAAHDHTQNSPVKTGLEGQVDG